MTETRLRAALAGLALVGLAIAAYLTYARYSGTTIACATGGCETVQNSRYAVIAGVPAAVLGLVAYTALFVAAVLPGARAAAVGAGLAVGGVLFSGYLLVAQLAFIHAVCQWCVASDVVISLLAALAVVRFLLVQRTATLQSA